MTTYLYVKTHTITGLKYLSKTKSNDPHKYLGSGKYWRRHLRAHGYTYTTEILKECEHPAMVEFWGQHYSNLWNIVESEEWANLKPETGDGGGSPRTTETKEKIREFQKNKIWTEKAIQTRLENCLKSAVARTGSSWSIRHRNSRLTTYLGKNLEIALQIFPLHDAGMNNRQISEKLDISWDKVKYSLQHREDFEAYRVKR
jgi:hypothetical protein